jgi:hypothetical protein
VGCRRGEYREQQNGEGGGARTQHNAEWYQRIGKLKAESGPLPAKTQCESARARL